VTFFTLAIEDTLGKVAAVLQLMKLRDQEDVGHFRLRRVLRVNVIGDLAVTVDGVLVVTTKENNINIIRCSHQSLPTSFVMKLCGIIGLCSWM